MIADDQTHSLPERRGGLAIIARWRATTTAPAFAAGADRALLRSCAAVMPSCSSPPPLADLTLGSLVFTGDPTTPTTLYTLEGTRLFSMPERVTPTVRGWHFGAIRRCAQGEGGARAVDRAGAGAHRRPGDARSDADLAFAPSTGSSRRLPADLQLFSMLRSNPGFSASSQVLGDGAAARRP
jgi:glutamine synthetase adenylyltransferase